MDQSWSLNSTFTKIFQKKVTFQKNLWGCVIENIFFLFGQLEYDELYRLYVSEVKNEFVKNIFFKIIILVKCNLTPHICEKSKIFDGVFLCIFCIKHTFLNDLCQNAITNPRDFVSGRLLAKISLETSKPFELYRAPLVPLWNFV